MNARHQDGSAGDANYRIIGSGYASYRRPDPQIAALITTALAGAHTVLNIGAGAGSYEPIDRRVTAVEPSAEMRAQRPPHLPAAINAVAESLPFDGQTFDGAMATFTVHQWPDLAHGLSEMRRVTRQSIVILTCDPDELDRFWLNDYAPEAIAVEARRYPRIEAIRNALGLATEVISVPIPLNCTDGFGEAYFGRPECLLDPLARKACSAWSFVDETVVKRFSDHLRRDLASGAWDAEFGHLRQQPQFLGSLKLIVARH